MSDILDRPPARGHNSAQFPELPTLAEQLEPGLYRDQLALDNAAMVVKRDERLAGAVRFVLRLSTVTHYLPDALPAAPKPYDLAVIEHPDRLSAVQFDGRQWMALSGITFFTRLVPTVVIPDEETYAVIVSFVKQMKEEAALAEAKRKQEKGVFDEAARIVQQFFKASIIDQLEGLAKLVEVGPLTAFTRARIAREEAIRMAEATRLQAEAAAALAAAGRTQSPDIADTAATLGAAADRATARAGAKTADLGRARGSLGGVSTASTTWKYRITDEALLPKRYWVIDHQALAADARRFKDKETIPGVEIYSEIGASVR